MAASPELLIWTREALEGLYDLAFLRRHSRAAGVDGRFADGRALQETLLGVIRQIRPPVDVPADSPAWRIYNTLNLRYVQGLPQSDVAARLSVGLRQARREQQRAVDAVATLLFDEPLVAVDGGLNPALAAAPGESLGPEPGREFAHLDELLATTLKVFDALLQRQGSTVHVTLAPALPAVPANRMILRQLLVSALGWLVQGEAGQSLEVWVSVASGQVAIQLAKPGAPAGTAAAAEELATLSRLSAVLKAAVTVARSDDRQVMTITLPYSRAVCVLMVDDNPHAIQLVQRYMQQTSEFYLAPVIDPRQAFHQAMGVRPGCILLDVMMPERDGWELLTLFKAHPETASIPIVVSSVLKEDELARALGAAAVLPKPFTAAQLVATLRQVTERAASDATS